MKIGIYNRHLTGVGGGEKHMLAIAEVLSHRHTVEVLTPHLLDLQAAGTQLGLDLSRVRLRPLEDRPESELAPVTAEYDLFINASDGTFLPSRARRSLLLVYFPTPVSRSRWSRLKWWLGHRLREVLLVPEWAGGFYGSEEMDGRVVRRLQQRARLRIPVSAGMRCLALRLEIGKGSAVPSTALRTSGGRRRRSDPAEGPALRPAEGPALSSVEGSAVTFGASGEPRDSTFVTFHIGDREVGRVSVERALTSVDLTVDGLEAPMLELEIRSPGDGTIVLGDVFVHHPRHRLYRQVFERWFPELGQKLLNLYPTLSLDHLDTYDVICANSRYTQEWIQRYWGRDSVVFYPPVDVEAFSPLPKRQQILSVGRFFTTGHNKKHLVMIRAFRCLVDEGLTGWELHLAGGTSLGALDAAYLERVRRAAVGYPIHVHTDIPFTELRRLYGESAIYWHATGYGEDPQRQPLRYEHFGLTTVEAMAAGCVPVVIHGGGQPEIVTHGVDGFLWRSLDELLDHTRCLVADERLRERMAVAARQRARAFGWQEFEKRLGWILGFDFPQFWG